MSFSQIIGALARLRPRNPIPIGLLVALTVLCPVFVYAFTRYSFDRIDERAVQAEREDRARQREDRARRIYDQLTSPRSGTTPEQISAVSIGMMAEQVEPILGLPHNLAIEIFPYYYTYNDLNWVVNDIPIKDVGYVQAVFINRQLVGLGSLDPNDGRLCGGCLEDMLRGERPWRAGLPFHVRGECPVCGSSRTVPFGVTLDRLQQSLYR